MSTSSNVDQKRRTKRSNNNTSINLSVENAANANPSDSIIQSLSLLDPILQFLTRATGQTLIPLETLKQAFPGQLGQKVAFQDFWNLVNFEILQVQLTCSEQRGGSTSNNKDAEEEKRVEHGNKELFWLWESDLEKSWNQEISPHLTQPTDFIEITDGKKPSSCINFQIGFPSGEKSEASRKLCWSTKTAAKRRLSALKQCLNKREKSNNITGPRPHRQYQPKMGTPTNASDIDGTSEDWISPPIDTIESVLPVTKDWTLPSKDNDYISIGEESSDAAQDAYRALYDVLGLHQLHANDSAAGGQTANDSASLSITSIPSSILPKQISYAGSHPAQAAVYEEEKETTSNGSESLNSREHGMLKLHPLIESIFLNGNHQRSRRQLYRHQAVAIRSALQNRHTLVCTGTGSGKSLCFWIPIIQKAVTQQKQRKSLVLFPTKALAQDQLVKLQSILERHPELTENYSIRADTLDGDTPHALRRDIASSCNIILTNPDTLHASILPNWSTMYKDLISELTYLVIDEAHMYEGVFGAHVAMILARLYRVHCCASTITRTFKSSLVYLACSATMAHPEQHFRLLCCIPSTQPVTVVTEDFSPRAAKHFFVWNPPLLDENRKSLGFVSWPKRKFKIEKAKIIRALETAEKSHPESLQFGHNDSLRSEANNLRSKDVHRRHSADETALLLARAMIQGARCIAFCKTRCLSEWVYERTVNLLKQSAETEKLITKLDCYRGGYTKMKRREIEEKLFTNQLLGIVGTSALELGVDIQNITVTLHCGFPSNHASLMQQAGRAGRGAAASHCPSLAICVCFNSPVDQHLWRNPSSLLSRGLSAALSMPVYSGLVQGHLMCAGKEFPLTGKLNVSAIRSVEVLPGGGLLSDEVLFGSKQVYTEALEALLSNGVVTEEKLAGIVGQRIYKTHPSIKKPWTKVSIRSIEAVNYDVVDISHPMQANRMDGSHNEAAVLDNIPYSRIFYHAFPGAIITHRGRRYTIESMTRPPPFGDTRGRTITLGAYAKPSTHRYFTRPLSTLKITVVRQMERVDCLEKSVCSKSEQLPDSHAVFDDNIHSCGSFAGCGVITVKRNVHGYRKLSLVTREELSRSELSLPDLEYDTFAFWLDCDASGLGRSMTPQDFGNGVHALSHALCNVSPLFVPCVLNDVQCDHSVFGSTRVVIFDARAGGSGISAQLWKHIFIPQGMVHAAIDLLEFCPSCSGDRGYSGGCPGCIQVGECIKFNDFLCKRSALVIAKHLLKRMEQTEVYRRNEKISRESLFAENCLGFKGSRGTHLEKRKASKQHITSPRRNKREKAMRVAKDIENARNRQMVVGRPSWK